MEKYQIKTSFPKPIKLGKFSENTYRRHEKEYGADSAQKIRDTAIKIIKKSFNQMDDIEKSNNILLVGKVQSGKTSNLEMISSLAFDNDYDLIIIYGGYDKTLLGQCFDRFNECYEEVDDQICLLSTDNADFDLHDESFFKSKFDEKIPVIITVMKRPNALDRVNDCLNRIKHLNVKALIIDDEGDQASLNTEFEENHESATYKSICNMKRLLNNPLYFSVTATPQANIFQPDFSELKPDSIHLIKPGNCYTGAEVFHLSNDRIYSIDPLDVEDMENLTLNKSIKKAIHHFIISSAIMYKRNLKKSDMIMHAYREINGHSALYDIVNSYITAIKESIKFEDGFDYYLDEFHECFKDSKCFSEKITSEYKWEDLIPIIKKVMNNLIVIQHNSEHPYDKNSFKYYFHQIHIGGDLLQRGITFKNLVTTYFTRWAKSGNMDTTLQRARWFGYREKIIDLCKIFTTDSIKKEFATLATIENDLWEQFEMIEDGQLSINDIIIDANDTSLNPTRKNVVQCKKVAFSQSWSKQKSILFDQNLVDMNNKLFDDMVSNITLLPSSVARNDGKVSTYYSYIKSYKFIDFVTKSNFIFDQRPFKKSDLIHLLEKEDEIIIEMMTSCDGLRDYRKRSVVDDTITYLQQGPDSSDEAKKHYDGDSNVIVDNTKVLIQVSKVLPEINDTEKEELKQYMFAIHFPKKSIVYSR